MAFSRKKKAGMIIDTRASGFSLTDAIQQHVEARVESALGPVSRWAQTLAVWLDDVIANRGGIDKRCRVILALRNRAMVVTEATDVDLYTAVDAATSRLRRAALRVVKRPFARDWTDARRPGTVVGAAS
jgi:ribosomal subunit interface protein